MSKRILIIEDEPRAVKRLERILTSLRPNWNVVAYADTVQGAIDAINTTEGIDAVFSDIQLADGLSFEAFEQVNLNLPVVFLTAYDHYAIRSFNHHSIDYLLKPTNEEDVLRAISKLEKHSFQSESNDLKALLATLQQEEKTYKDRFLVKFADKLRFFSVADIACFYSEEKVTSLMTTEKRSYPVDMSLEQVEQLLDPKKFFRINRKMIISPDAISEMTSWSNSRLRVVIKGKEEEVIVVARERTASFKDWLDS